MRKEKVMQHVLMLLIGVMLIMLLGGCVHSEIDWEEVEKETLASYDENLEVEEIDAGTYMITDSVDNIGFMDSWSQRLMKKGIFNKARKHCAQENKAIKLVSRKGESGSYSESSSIGGLTGGGLFGGHVGSGKSSKVSEFEIIFKCRERTTPAATPAPTPDAP